MTDLASRKPTLIPSDPADRPRVALPLLWLALPVLAEQILHMAVGMVDTYLALNLPADHAQAAAAVGTISSFVWFIGLIVGAVGTGSTAIIARATGAKHRRLANSVAGQSVTAVLAAGLVTGVVLYVLAGPATAVTGLPPAARQFAESYLRILAPGLPFLMLTFIANACQRGAGDTLTPAIVMIVVDVVNVFFSFALTYGWWGFPTWGFDGIAAGTVLAYVVGGLLQAVVLLSGLSKVRLFVHRLRPHWHTMKRILRIGLPSGLENLLGWGAHFIVLVIINTLDPTSRMPAAHRNAVVIEAASYLVGFAFATATAATVGQALGRRNPRLAQRAAYAAYGMAGSFMGLMGLFFIFFGHYPARWMSPQDPVIIDMTTRCLFITGFCQTGFAAAMVFSGALRGAGDTRAAMAANLTSVLGIRLLGVLIVGYWLRMSLSAVWVVLSAELFLRGCIVYVRFLQGRWRQVEV